MAQTATLRASRLCFVLPDCLIASSESNTSSIAMTNSFLTSVRPEGSPNDGFSHANDAEPNGRARPLYEAALAAQGLKLLYVTIWPATGLWSERALQASRQGLPLPA